MFPCLSSTGRSPHEKSIREPRDFLMEPSKSACALGLYKYKYNCDQSESDLFGRFYSTILHQFRSYGVAPTYIGAEGNGYSGKFTKFSGRTHDKLVESHFAGITALSIVANPRGSEEPSYDNFANASLGFVEVNRELLACVVINESFVKLRSTEYDALMRSQVELCRWDFGYGFSSSTEKQPDFHILGLDNGKLSAEEYKSLRTWYAASCEIRTSSLRDIYAYNLLNGTQLDAHIRDGKTLRQFAQRQPGCSLTRLTDYDLYLWQVPDTDIARLRELLVGTPALIS